MASPTQKHESEDERLSNDEGARKRRKLAVSTTASARNPGASDLPGDDDGGVVKEQVTNAAAREKDETSFTQAAEEKAGSPFSAILNRESAAERSIGGLGISGSGPLAFSNQLHPSGLAQLPSTFQQLQGLLQAPDSGSGNALLNSMSNSGGSDASSVLLAALARDRAAAAVQAQNQAQLVAQLLAMDRAAAALHTQNQAQLAAQYLARNSLGGASLLPSPSDPFVGLLQTQPHAGGLTLGGTQFSSALASHTITGSTLGLQGQLLSQLLGSDPSANAAMDARSRVFPDISSPLGNLLRVNQTEVTQGAALNQQEQIANAILSLTNRSRSAQPVSFPTSISHASSIPQAASQDANVVLSQLLGRPLRQEAESTAAAAAAAADTNNAVVGGSLAGNTLRPFISTAGVAPAPIRNGPDPTTLGTIPLALDDDSEKLSAYQILVRRQLEFFVAGMEDVESNTQGRKKRLFLGQIGMRCRHCAHIPIRKRSRGAVYYPSKLSGVYQAAQNMATSHLLESCDDIDDDIREELQTLRDRHDSATGGKSYWAEACQKVGVCETENGLKLRSPSRAGP